MTAGRTYLQGWCHRAADIRTFRTDRIVALTDLDTPAAPPPDAGPPPDTLFSASPQDRLVTLRLEPRARWVADYYPCESVSEAGQDRLMVTLRSRESRWLIRLVMRLGSQATVLGPKELVADVAREAVNALIAYADAGVG